MKNRILLAALLAGALVTVSCNKDRTLYYNSLEMGVLQADGRIITDGGLTYSVTENGTEYTLSGKEGRIIFLADVLQETSDLHYDIRLKNIATVPTPDLIKEQDLPSSADNAVRVNSAWFGGGFLNLSLSYLVEPSSTVEHQIRFAEQTVENGKDTLFIRIYHDAAGEFWDGTKDLAESDLVLTNDYYSIPIDAYRPTSDTRPIKLFYRWYTYENDEILAETRLYPIEGELVK